MAEHYTRNTLECTGYCKKCQRFTQHRVDGGRRGPCIDPGHPVAGTKKDELRKRKAEQRRQNPPLFE